MAVEIAVTPTPPMETLVIDGKWTNFKIWIGQVINHAKISAHALLAYHVTMCKESTSIAGSLPHSIVFFALEAASIVTE